jgi:UDP-3-O-[3-hydroxymyristoyl] glucosamine N-acyltransferase
MRPSWFLDEVAARIGAELLGDAGRPVSGVADLDTAGPEDVAPLTDPSRREDAGVSRAGAFLVAHPLSDLGRPQLVCPDARRGLGALLELFAPSEPAPAPTGVDPRAAVGTDAVVHPSAWVGPFTYLGDHVRVGPGTRVEPFTYLGARVQVGERCRLGPRATVMEGCEIGDHVVLAPGTVVGGEGFGFWSDQGGWHRLRSAGSVRVESEVEVGAGSCVDRATLGETRIGRGTKIDNLVQVAHNVQVGEDALICAQVGLAGSVRLGDGAVLAGQVGVADHLRIGPGARVGGKSGVTRDVPGNAEVSGYPAIPHRRWLRASVMFSRLSEIAREVQELRRTLAELFPGRAASGDTPGGDDARHR